MSRCPAATRPACPSALPLLPASSPCSTRPCCLRAAPAPRATAAYEQPLPTSTPVRARRVARPRPPAVPGTHGMALRPSS
ncbi:unnamed protein product, partial [Closterium sp. NIES-54]